MLDFLVTYCHLVKDYIEMENTCWKDWFFFFKVCNIFSFKWKRWNYWNSATIVTWFKYRPVCFRTGLWVIQFQWSVIKILFFLILYHFCQFYCFFNHNFKVSYFSHILKILFKCLVLRFSFFLIFSFIHDGSLSSTVMTWLLTNVEKKLNSVLFSIFTCFLTFALENYSN